MLFLSNSKERAMKQSRNGARLPKWWKEATTISPRELGFLSVICFKTGTRRNAYWSMTERSA